MTFAEQMQDLAENVFGEMKPGSGYDHGDIDGIEKKLGIRVPGPLREFYVYAGKHEQVSAGMNQLFPPEELRIEDGSLVFCEENQGCFAAGIRLEELASADPAVREQNIGDENWYLASRTLSQYLLVTFCWQACNALDHVEEATYDDQHLGNIEKYMRRAQLEGENGYVDTVAFWGRHVALVAFPKSMEIYCAARDRDAIAEIEKLLGLEFIES